MGLPQQLLTSNTEYSQAERSLAESAELNEQAHDELANTADAADNHRRDTVFPQRFVTIALYSNGIASVVALIAYLSSHSLIAGSIALIFACVSLGLFWALRRIQAAQPNWAGLILYSITIAAGMLGVLLIPNALPAAIFTPIMAVVMSMTYLQRSLLRWLSLLAWFATLAMFLLGEYVRLFPATPWASGLPLTFALLYCTGLLLYLLWRYHVRLTQALAQSNDANRKLHSIRANLETTIAMRTEALRERESHFRAIAELTSDYAFQVQVNQDGTFDSSWVADALQHLTNLNLIEAGPIHSLAQFVHADDYAMIKKILASVLTNQIQICEFRVRARAGTVRWLRSYLRPEWSIIEQRVSRVLVALQDITERKQYERQIEQLALYDPLTGLANRRLFQNHAQAALDSRGAMFAILFLDLDRFKEVNDTLGHEIGDELLQQVALRLHEAIGDQGHLARFGGDEFALLLPNVDVTTAIAVARQLVSELDASFHVRGHTLRVTTSIGIACSPHDGVQISTLLKHADIAMYRAKRRNEPIGVYDPGTTTHEVQRLQMEVELRQALDRNELVLYYQPICEIPSRRVLRVEALVRWDHPQLGLVSPGVFIPIAEECGLIRDLDRWVLRNAMAQVAAWAAAGNQLRVAINLSAHSLQDLALTKEIAAMLRASGAPSHQVIIEVTESTAMIDVETTLQVLDQLNELGIAVAIDDFGAGYASLSRLKYLPFKILKVDRAFVAGIGRDRKDEGVLNALITLSHGLNIDIVAEGVETVEQLSWLVQAGYTHLQGYLIGYPVLPNELNSQVNHDYF